MIDERDRLVVLERDVAHLDKTLSEVKADMKSGFQRLDADVKELRTDMKSGFGEIRVEMAEIRRESQSNFKWLLGVFGGGVVALATFMYFLFSQIQ